MVVPSILVALTIHELSHALAALMLGDDTAKRSGRITLNPLKHVDPIGFVMLVFAGFGWAKPVVFDREKLKKKVRDEILIAFAGPVSNLILGFLATLILRIGAGAISSPAAFEMFVEIVTTFIGINLGLAVFNMLPIPPLDGSHVFAKFAFEGKSRIPRLYMKYGFMILIGIILLERITGYDILPIGRVTGALFRVMLRVVGLA